MHLCLQPMGARGKGHVLNVSSTASICRPVPFEELYSGTKHLLTAVGRAVHFELASNARDKFLLAVLQLHGPHQLVFTDETARDDRTLNRRYGYSKKGHCSPAYLLSRVVNEKAAGVTHWLWFCARQASTPHITR